MQVSGPADSVLLKQNYPLTEASSPIECRRILGPQCFTLITTSPDNEVSTFWITGGVNRIGPGFEVPYQQSSTIPAPVSCIVIGVDPEEKSTYKNVFKVTTTLGVILIFRFSPSGVFKPIVEVDSFSVDFSATLTQIALEPAKDQNLVSFNGHYPRTIERKNVAFAATAVNTALPLGLFRTVGLQLWNVEISDGVTSIEGGKILLDYGNRRNPGGYIGTISPLATPRILYQLGVTVTPVLPTSAPGSQQFERTFRITMPISGRNFDIWLDPLSRNPTIRLTGAAIPGGQFLVVRIQTEMYHS